MNNQIRILFIEDLPSDVKLAEFELRMGGIHFISKRVDTEKDLLGALKDFQPDIAICDYSIPVFDGMQALKIVLDHDCNLPVIMLTGSMNELIAVECMKAGAIDYVIKEHITRLPFAVAEALEKQKLKLAAEKASMVIRESEERFRTLFTEMMEGFALHEIICDNSGNPVDYRFLEMNPAFERLTGLNANEVLGKSILEILPDTEKYWIEIYGSVALTGKPEVFENFSKELNKHFKVIAFSNKKNQFVTVFEDITSRRKSEESLRATSFQLGLALDSAKAGIWDWNVLTGNIEWSPQMFVLFGLDPNCSVASFESWRTALHPEDQLLAESRIEQALKEHNTLNSDYRVVMPGGEIRWIFATGEGIYDNNGNPVQMIGICTDIGERKATEEMLRKSEETLKIEKENFRHSLEESPLGVRIVSGEGKTIYANKAMLSLYGFDTLEELQTTNLKKRYTKESYAEALIRKHNRDRGDFSALNYEISIVRKDGVTCHLKVHRKKVLWDGVWQFQVIYEDITNSRNREIELEEARKQLEQLNLYLQNIREEERRLIARELHDELGQALTAVKIDLGNLKMNIGDKKSMESKIEKISLLVSDSIGTVKRLTSELRPHILDDLGLISAINWYTSEYKKRTGINIKLEIDKKITLKKEIELVIFRILQESLTNIARHSEAKNTLICFSRNSKGILLEIKDDGVGVGFSSANMEPGKSFGLLNMKERAKDIGGTLLIESEPNNGTVIRLLIPGKLQE